MCVNYEDIKHFHFVITDHLSTCGQVLPSKEQPPPWKQQGECSYIGASNFTEVALLVDQMVAPHEGHLYSALDVAAYLKSCHNAHMLFDPTYPEIEYGKFTKQEWKSFYSHIQEAKPPNAPELHGKGIDL